MERFGDYILLEKAASGGMADIYKAVKVGARGFFKLLAVKRIRPHICEDVTFQDMFVREAHVLSNLAHPNVAQIYDLGSVRNQFYIAMEFIQGQDLGTVLKAVRDDENLWTEEIALYIAAAIAEGLDYVHNMKDPEGRDLNIVHRDINPKNIFISYQGAVKIIDFGVARTDTDTEKTKAGVIKGKLAYLSPEQLEASSVDRRTDVFAAGLVLYEMLGRRRLFKGETETRLLKDVMVLDIDSQVADLPVHEALQQILHQALSRNLDTRFQTCAAYKECIEVYARDWGFTLSPQSLRQLMETLFAADCKREQEKNRAHFEMLQKETSSGGAEETRFIDMDETGVLSPAAAALQVEGGTVYMAPELSESSGRRPDIPASRKSLVALAAMIFLVVIIGLVFLLRRPSSPPLPEVQPRVVVPQASESVREPVTPTPPQAVSSPTVLTEPSAALPAAAYVVLDGSPGGQRVFINGQEKGIIPMTIELSPGFAEVECRKPGYLPFKVSVRLKAGQIVDLTSDLVEE